MTTTKIKFDQYQFQFPLEEISPVLFQNNYETAKNFVEEVNKSVQPHKDLLAHKKISCCKIFLMFLFIVILMLTIIGFIIYLIWLCVHSSKQADAKKKMDEEIKQIISQHQQKFNSQGIHVLSKNEIFYYRKRAIYVLFLEFSLAQQNLNAFPQQDLYSIPLNPQQQYFPNNQNAATQAFNVQSGNTNMAPLVELGRKDDFTKY